MSGHVSAEAAKELLEGATPGPWSIDQVDPDYPELQGAPKVEFGFIRTPILITDILGQVSVADAELIAAAPDLSETVVAQAEQVKRLQAAVRFLESVWGSDVLTELREKGIINPGDMEEPQ